VIDDFDTITPTTTGRSAQRRRPPGRYEVAPTPVKKRKVRCARQEDDAPLADWTTSADADNQPLYLEKRKIEREESAFTIVVDRKPRAPASIRTTADRPPAEGQYGGGGGRVVVGGYLRDGPRATKPSTGVAESRFAQHLARVLAQQWRDA
jgi:hypothetical protein